MGIIAMGILWGLFFIGIAINDRYCAEHNKCGFYLAVIISCFLSIACVCIGYMLYEFVKTLGLHNTLILAAVVPFIYSIYTYIAKGDNIFIVAIKRLKGTNG